MKIKIVMNELYLGGVEKSIINFFNFNKDISFDLFIPKYGKNTQLKDIPKNVTIKYYDQKNIVSTLCFLSLRLLFFKIKEKENYDITIDYSGISPITNYNTLISKNKKYFIVHSDFYSYSRTS